MKLKNNTPSVKKEVKDYSSTTNNFFQSNPKKLKLINKPNIKLKIIKKDSNYEWQTKSNTKMIDELLFPIRDYNMESCR